jgi:hypothetical protein
MVGCWNAISSYATTMLRWNDELKLWRPLSFGKNEEIAIAVEDTKSKWVPELEVNEALE